jgi:hypothetical protein
MRLDGAQVKVVEAELKYRGWWFPPDAIQAVSRGRDSYAALDNRTVWSVTRPTREVIRAALVKTNYGRTLPSYLKGKVGR